MQENKPKKILIIAPSWVGDVVMSQVLFRLLKQQDPTCLLDVLANESLHPLLKLMPEVNNCLSLPFGHGELKLFKRYQFAKELRKKSYTHAYILPNSFKSALISLWAKIPIRTGWRGEFRYLLLNDIRTGVDKISLMVERFAALGIKKNEPLSQPVLLPQLKISAKKAQATLERFGIILPTKPILALCPGAEYGVTKRWPPAYFAEVAKVKKSEGWDIWIFGGPKDKIIAEEIQARSNKSCFDFTGKTSLSEVTELLSLVTVVITNDSGLMHIAAALNLKMIAIYGSTSAKYTPPLSDQAKIISLSMSCSPCMKRTCPLKHMKCLNDLTPEMVLSNIKDK